MNEDTSERVARRRRRIVLIIRLQLVIVIVLLSWRATQLVHRWIAVRPSFLVESSASRTLENSSWLETADVESIRSASGMDSSLFSFFQPDLTRRYVDGYARSPWVKRVIDVRPVWPNRIRVFLEVRKPLLGVLQNGRDIYLVDERGVRLPGVRRRPPEGLSHPFFRLDGILTPVPTAGEVWSRAAMEGAAVAGELITMSDDMLAAARIQTIDVSNVGGRDSRLHSEVLLGTESGAVIEWGRSAASPRRAVEPPRADKLKRLRRALLLYPGLTGLARVKLQYDELTVVETGAGDGLAAHVSIR